MIYSMGLVAAFMLLLAIANFVNLSTAKAALANPVDSLRHE